MNSILDENNFYDFTDALRNRGRYMRNLGKTMEAFSQELYPTNVSNIQKHFDMISSNNSELSLLGKKLNEIERSPYYGYESVPFIFSIKLKAEECGSLRSKCWAESLSWISWDLSVIDRGDYYSDFTYFLSQMNPLTYSPDKVRMVTTKFGAFDDKSVAEQVSNIDVAGIYGHNTPDKICQFTFRSISEVNDFFGKVYEDILAADLLIVKAERFIKINDLDDVSDVIKVGISHDDSDAVALCNYNPWCNYNQVNSVSTTGGSAHIQYLNSGSGVKWTTSEIDDLKKEIEDLKKRLDDK